MRTFYIKKSRFIYFIFLKLFIFVRLENYISVKLQDSDDCLLELKINNNIHYKFAPETNEKCMMGDYSNTPARRGDFILTNYEYKLNEKLEFIIGDSDHTEGWIIMNIYFNEYHIKTRDHTFWICKDCGHSANTNYYYHHDGYCSWAGHWPKDV